MRIPNGSRDVLAVDPGVMGTGWAVLHSCDEQLALRLTGTITPRHPDDEWLTRIEFVTNAFASLLETLPEIETVAMESPAFHSGVAGLAVASTGALTKLAMLTGALIACVQGHHLRLVLATPSMWKGQLPKAVTWKRCQEILGSNGNDARTTSHARDAVGIGLWALGRF